MTAYALRLQNSTDTAARVRMADLLGLTPTGNLSARGGIRPGPTAADVAVTGGTMQVTVQPFLAFVDGGVSDTQGGYPFVNDAVVTLTLANGHATLSRTDVVAAVVRDNAYDSGGSTTAAVEVIQGTPGAGVPAVPANSIPLRNIVVPAGASTGTGGLSSGALSTDRRTYVSGLGGVLTVATQAERDALPAINGTIVYRKDTDLLEVRRAGTWQTLHAYTDDPWHTVGGAGEPAFQNAWGSAGQAVQFRKDRANNLHIRGLAGSGIAAVCFTLPAGYTPTADWTQMQTYNTGDVQAVVRTTGNVELQTKAGAPTVFGVFVVCSLA